MKFPISRFNFNIKLSLLFKEFFLSFLIKDKKNFTLEIKKKLKFFFPYSNFYFYSYGRTAFYVLLKELRKQTNKNKIIINSFTLFEMINTIIYAGFEPILIDLKQDSFQSSFTEAIKKNKKNLAAIVVTHFNGFNDDILKVKEIVSKENEEILIIEDTAVGFGSKNKEIYSGNYGDYSILSFNIMKNITTLSGGALIENNNKIIIDKNQVYIRNQTPFNIFKKIIFVSTLIIINLRLIFFLFFKFIKFSKMINFNFFLKKYRTDFKLSIKDKIPNEYLYNLSDFQKKILLPQFDDFNHKQSERIKKSKYYYYKLKDIKQLTFPQVNFDTKNIFIDFPILIKKNKNNLVSYLMYKNIDIKDYYYSNCGDDNIYSKFIFDNVNNSKTITNEIIMLPVGQNINQEYQNIIIEEINNFFKK